MGVLGHFSGNFLPFRWEFWAILLGILAHFCENFGPFPWEFLTVLLGILSHFVGNFFVILLGILAHFAGNFWAVSVASGRPLPSPKSIISLSRCPQQEGHRAAAEAGGQPEHAAQGRERQRGQESHPDHDAALQGGPAGEATLGGHLGTPGGQGWRHKAKNRQVLLQTKGEIQIFVFNRGRSLLS